MKHISIILLIILLATACQNPSTEKKEQAAMNNAKFQRGQVWKFDSKPGEENATFTILKIEDFGKDDTVVHVRVDGIKLFNPHAPGGYSNNIEHLPFAYDAIEKSATKLINTQKNVPDFSEGYKEWKKAVDSGKGGIWSITVGEAVAAMDSAMRQNNH